MGGEDNDTPQVDKAGNPKMQLGYFGKPKGMEQLLRERGLFVQGMTPDGTKIKKKTKVYLGDHLNMKLTLNNCPDYKSERTALETLAEEIGVVVESSPKCHPEIAGEGIEYTFAAYKMDYRKKNTYCSRTMHTRVLASLDVLNVTTIRKCCRRANEYMRAYLKLPVETTQIYEKIESMKEESKCHRCALDFDTSWVKQLFVK